MGGLVTRFLSGGFTAGGDVLLVALVLVVVAVQAKQLPVASVGGIVVVVVVSVVNGQLAQVRVVEAAAAATADPGIEFECLFPVALLTLVPSTTGAGDDQVQAIGVYGLTRLGAVWWCWL